MNAECVINNWLIDISAGALIHQQNGEQRRLGEYQLKLLIVMIQHADQILTREELNTLVWERRVIGSNSLPNAIHALRVALEDDGKQQRIIKTIPKKGYMLDASFCHFRRLDVDKDPQHEQPESARLSGEDRISGEEAERLPPAEEWIAEPLPESEQQMATQHDKYPRRLWQGIFLLQIIVLTLATVIWLNDNPPQPRFEEFQAGVYSQIRLLQLEQFNPRNEGTREEINSILGSTLIKLEHALKERQVKMDIYFHSSVTLLNLTISLRSRCDQRQLAMNLFHWRQDITKLNSLIFNETERKLNEMAVCVN
ncbi:transcriptional regulator [Erwiniaceae bacterium BAC15a-03b]|uniref:Transcriptional regulator n=1 Tax=Winslowiella arboricola TaxID=2978220 RepID=A0A9J6PR57_9GAMM|nr:transcriptional regulator [Winslowiella arboricola]MCU5774502.1 transcriptional regulator [Winslowiella arboricola]MCU5778088.1 transcriptional regulator [Winslowiella arboricola]